MHLSPAVTLRSVLGAAALTLLAALGPAPAPAATAPTSCDLVAAAGGGIGASGTASDPLGSAQTLVERLQPGQTGCIRGEMRGNVAIRLPDRTLMSEPGQRGRVVGQLKVMDGASNVVVRDLDINGVTEPEKPSVGIYADDVSFIGNDITNQNQEICVIVGYGTDDIVAERTLIQGNRIHDCGELPSTNRDHGIYVETARNGRIIGNEIIDNVDRGIQLYPWAHGMYVAGNVIDGNGEGVHFGGLAGTPASNNTVRYNVITNARIRYEVESWYPSDTPAGTGNVVDRNCISTGGVSLANGGFTTGENLFGDPGYADRAGRNFTLPAGSQCAELLAAGRAGMEWTPAPPVAPAPAPTAPSKPKPSKPGKSGPVKVQVTPSTGDTLDVQVRLVDQTVQTVRARVEVRYGTKRWKKLATTRITRTKRYRAKVKAPRKTRKVQVRATVLRGAKTRKGRSVRVTLSRKAGSPRQTFSAWRRTV